MSVKILFVSVTDFWEEQKTTRAIPVFFSFDVRHAFVMPLDRNRVADIRHFFWTHNVVFTTKRAVELGLRTRAALTFTILGNGEAKDDIIRPLKHEVSEALRANCEIGWFNSSNFSSRLWTNGSDDADCIRTRRLNGKVKTCQCVHLRKACGIGSRDSCGLAKCHRERKSRVARLA